jgi:hypothetical protein
LVNAESNVPPSIFSQLLREAQRAARSRPEAEDLFQTFWLAAVEAADRAVQEYHLGPGAAKLLDQQDLMHPALHIPRVRGREKGEGRARRPKFKVSGQRSVGCLTSESNEIVLEGVERATPLVARARWQR